jgi:hypothetical protein
MSYNTSAYLVFILLMLIIIVYVGRYFYKNGRIFILSLMKNNSALSDSINNILLAGYYLLNIGYAFIMIRSWPAISSFSEWISSLSTNMGMLILILAFLHYGNMMVIHLLSKKNFINNKPFLL